MSDKRLCHFLCLLFNTILAVVFIAPEVANVLIDQLRLLVIFVSVLENLSVLTHLYEEFLVFL